MTSPRASTSGLAARATALLDSLSTPGVAVLAAAIPALFVHRDYELTTDVGVGGEELTLAFSDFAIVAVAVAALVAGRRLGWQPLSRGRAPLVAAGILLAVVAVWTFLPVALGREYALAAHLVSAAKLAEYALLAPAVALLVRTRADLRLVLAVVVVWAAAATVVAVLQFVGVLPEPRGFRPGEREPSFLGYHDFGALAGAALSVGLVHVALRTAAGLRTVLVATAIAGGVVGVVLSGALAVFVGTTVAAVAVALVARRRGVLTATRAIALLAVVAVTGAGVVALRAANIDAFLRFVGVTPARDVDTFGGESYVQRLALGYIGVRIVRDHPLDGVGWQSTSEEWTYAPYVDDARRRYPRLPERLLPAPDRPWGIQNAYIQAAAEFGLVAVLAFVAALLVPIRRAWRLATSSDAADAAIPLLWLLVCAGVWLGLGLVVGIPMLALFWIAVGLSMAAVRR